MKLGISSYAYTWAIGVPGQVPSKPMSCFKLLEQAIRLNVSCIQMADNLPLHQLDHQPRFELLNGAQDAGIGIEVGMRGLTKENFIRYLDLAEYFRSPILRTVIDAGDFRPGLSEIISMIRDFLPDLIARNIQLAIENHDRLKATEFARIIETIGDTHVGICLDTVNSMGAGEGFEEVLRVLGPYTINFHIKDFIVKRAYHMMGFSIEGTPAGQGMLPIEEILAKLEKWGVCESGILELWTPPANNIPETILRENEWVEQSIEFLKPLFNKDSLN
ncbi:MAG: sugar phosphate isomerase/epimerase [Cyclobacteriaceae bacterium]|nr:sugar phosphate isomerase/epimerase [Cyclobacteriaceae bacterium]